MNAVQALLEVGICTLPVALNSIADYYNIKIVDYDAYARCYAVEKERLYLDISANGFSLFEDGQFVCVLNGNACGRSRRRWTLAHEIAHILLGHIKKRPKKLSEECEREADRFAAELLAPLDVLHFCGVSSAEEIAYLCGLSKQAAAYRYDELMRLRRQHTAIRKSVAMGREQEGENRAFLIDDERKQLFDSFLPFVADYLSERAKHDEYVNHIKRLIGTSI